jgi:hypothetical protein
MGFRRRAHFTRPPNRGRGPIRHLAPSLAYVKERPAGQQARQCHAGCQTRPLIIHKYAQQILAGQGRKGEKRERGGFNHEINEMREQEWRIGADWRAWQFFWFGYPDRRS